MNKLRFLFSLVALALVLGVGATLNAQEDKQQPPDRQNSPAQTTPQQPDSDAQSPTPVATAQTFTGTIVKSGDKFVLQEENGTTYDVDKQELVKPFEGKKVNIKGMLDGKMIRVQQK